MKIVSGMPVLRKWSGEMGLTDQQIEQAFKGTKFGAIDGDVKAQRFYLAKSVMKKACGYSTGYTITNILIELGLISLLTHEPSKAAMRWAFDVYKTKEEEINGLRSQIGDIEKAKNILREGLECEAWCTGRECKNCEEVCDARRAIWKADSVHPPC